MPEQSESVVERIRSNIRPLKIRDKAVDQELLAKRFEQCIRYAVDEAYKHADRKDMTAEALTKQLIENDLVQQEFYREF
ncbi:hypothetical protein [Marinobacter sp. SS8-8]|uniref:hypothetical protein n=1 Tax=Marinobacter sp. SS8-8 TaxID=3050452 RepID=UPI0026E0C3FE|nr:hypothetical protein [Marinobacter sp. SS8-8]